MRNVSRIHVNASNNHVPYFGVHPGKYLHSKSCSLLTMRTQPVITIKTTPLLARNWYEAQPGTASCWWLKCVVLIRCWGWSITGYKTMQHMVSIWKWIDGRAVKSDHHCGVESVWWERWPMGVRRQTVDDSDVEYKELFNTFCVLLSCWPIKQSWLTTEIPSKHRSANLFERWEFNPSSTSCSVKYGKSAVFQGDPL